MAGGRELEARVAELEKQLGLALARIAKLEAENEQLRVENAALRKVLDEAQRAGKRQAGPFSRNNPKQNPKTPGRKGGSEYGVVSDRPVPDRIDQRIEVPCPLWCSCGGQVTLEGVVRHYQTDIPPVEPSTIEFAIQYGRCTECGRPVQGRDSCQTSDATGAVGGVQIGPQAIALAAHLNKACGLSYERIMELFAQVAGFGCSGRLWPERCCDWAEKPRPRTSISSRCFANRGLCIRMKQGGEWAERRHGSGRWRP